eukprot:10042087-Lingulodinium_polyedra.AAC.1
MIPICSGCPGTSGPRCHLLRFNPLTDEALKLLAQWDAVGTLLMLVISIGRRPLVGSRSSRTPTKT